MITRIFSMMASNSCRSEQGARREVEWWREEGLCSVAGLACSVSHLPWPGIVSFEWISWLPAVTSKAPVPHAVASISTATFPSNSCWRKDCSPLA